MRIVLCYPAEECHVEQIAAIAPGDDVIDAGQEGIAEAILTDHYLANDTAAELLILSDRLCCAQLKEASLLLCIKNAPTVEATEDWAKVEESPKLLKELFSTSCKLIPGHKTMDDEISHFSVIPLLERLQAAKRPCDGTRDVLVKRLKEYHAELTAAQHTRDATKTSQDKINDNEAS